MAHVSTPNGPSSGATFVLNAVFIANMTDIKKIRHDTRSKV